MWQKLGLDRLELSMAKLTVDDQRERNGTVIIHTTTTYRGKHESVEQDKTSEDAGTQTADLLIEHCVTYTAASSGVELKNDVSISGHTWNEQLGELKTLPRVGVRWAIDPDAQVTYYGRGPHENYSDRAHG